MHFHFNGEFDKLWGSVHIRDLLCDCGCNYHLGSRMGCARIICDVTVIPIHLIEKKNRIHSRVINHRCDCTMNTEFSNSKYCARFVCHIYLTFRAPNDTIVDLTKNPTCTSFCLNLSYSQNSKIQVFLGSSDRLSVWNWMKASTQYLPSQIHSEHMLSITKYTEIISSQFYQQSTIFSSPKWNYFTPERNANVIPSINL